ncbi:MAG: hypothetical protein R6V55_16380 [Desulfovermiculus sp.]
MGQTIEHPLPVYQTWFSQIPLAHRRRLALGFWLFTTENTADMAMSHNQALDRFQAYLGRPDFPLRLLSRMIIVRGMTTYLLGNREILEQGSVFAKDQDNSNVLDLSETIWKKTWAGWQQLIAEELSDKVFSAWTRQAV